MFELGETCDFPHNLPFTSMEHKTVIYYRDRTKLRFLCYLKVTQVYRICITYTTSVLETFADLKLDTTSGS